MTATCRYDADTGYASLALRGLQEGVRYEYASYRMGPEESDREAHPELAALYQSLPETPSGEPSEVAQPEQGGNAHDVSGDGCGDGGYCGGHWVRRSEGGHRQGEAIGGDPWEPVNAYCAVFWRIPMVAGACGVAGSVEFATK
jgi:hypothetical protein